MTQLKTPPALPSDEQLTVTDYALGRALSDLNEIERVLDAQDTTIPIEEAVERMRRGDRFEQPSYDRDQLARLVVFAAEALEDASEIARYARSIKERARRLYRESAPEEQRRAYWEIVNRWHQAEAEANSDGR